MDSKQLHREIGEIKGLLQGVAKDVAEIKGKQGSLDERVRKVEVRTFAYGTVGGGIVAIGIALVAEKLKRAIGGS